MTHTLALVRRRMAAWLFRQAALPRRRPCLRLEVLEERENPTGTYTGVVFQDFNADGIRELTQTITDSSGNGTIAAAIDRGMGGVVVTAYNTAGTQVGTTTTAANGTFSLTPAGTGPYRIEFTGLPAGFSPGPIGPDSGTQVRFAADGGAAGVNLGVVTPEDYAPTNPTLVSVVYPFGNPAGSNFSTLVSFPYAAGASPGGANDNTPTAHTLAVPYSQLGAVYGLGENRLTGAVYASAFMKRHTGFGPGGTGAIYAVNPTTGAVSLFADVNNIPGLAASAGADPHNLADFDTDNFNTTWDAVGKASLGGLDVSPDGQFVYVMNLADRSLYRIPTSGPINSGTVVRQQIPLTAPGATGVNGADLRPFAVTFYRGSVYVGIVNSAESTGLASDLHAYVYRVDPTTLQFDPAPAFTIANLTYTRGALETFNGTPSANWNAWVSTFRNVAPSGVGGYPQPMLTGIAFDAAGNMTVGLRDRAGDQFGFFTEDNPASPTTRFEGVAGGDTLFAAVNVPNNPGAGWTLESNARVTTPGNVNNFGPTAGANNGQGPGGGEYFYQDNNSGNLHQETTGGGLLQLAGYPDVVVTAFDPGSNVRTGGFVWFNETTGAKDKGYEVYNTGFNGNTPTAGVTFSKANGLGEVTALIDTPPIEIGNLVFKDLNGNGVQDAGEPGIAGVTVQLVDGGGAVLGIATTDANGNYYFSNTAGGATGSVIKVPGLLPNTTYTVRIPNAVGGGQQAALAALTPTLATVDSGPNSTQRDSDGTLAGTAATSTVTTGGLGTSNFAIDFGFATAYSLGNRVWRDRDNSGTINAADGPTPGIGGVAVNLYADANNDGTPDGPAVVTTTTDANGYYRFDNLVTGTYVVEVVTTSPAFAGLIPSTVTGGDPDTDIDGDSNGTVTGAGFVRSQPVTLGPGDVEPTGEADVGSTGGARDNRSNLTADFGFTDAYYSVAGNIYDDANNNGLIDGTEGLITGQPVTITLTGNDVSGTPVSLTTTTSTGTYSFTNLRPSDAAGYTLTETTQPVGFIDGKDTPGMPFGGTAPAVGETIGGVVIPTGAANDGVANAGVNYNFGERLPAALGDFVWLDANGNGRQDPGEPGIDGITVTLTGSDVNGPVSATTVTSNGGAYGFTGLLPGTYTVTFGNTVGGTTYTFTTQSSAVATAATDSDADPTTGQSAAVTLVAGQLDSDIDAGLTLLASVGDTVWYDVNNNGVQDAGEPGIGGATVTLDYAGPDGTFGTADDQLAVGTQTTAADGTYLFDNLFPGTYRTRVDTATLPAGLTTPTFDLDGIPSPNQATFPLAAAQNRRNADFGYRGTASLGDTVWYDLDRSGTRNNNEPGIAGVTVTLTWAGPDGAFGTADDLTYPTKNTFASGTYVFPNLPAGTFRVAVDSTSLPGGVTVNTYDLDSGTTNPDGTTDTTLTVGQNRTDVDFGYTGTGSIGDRVWLDSNGDGVQDPAEPGIGGATVSLTWFGPDGAAGGGDDVTLTQTTGANGIYTFGGLPPGNYNVQVTAVPGGLTLTGDPQGPLDGRAAVPLAAGQAVTTIDFGYRGTSSISGTVFLDANNDGTQGPTEGGLPGTTVTLAGTDSLGNGVNLTTATGPGGAYSFTDLVPGAYTVTETQPTLYGDGIDTLGSVNGTPTGTPSNDQFSNIVLNPGDAGINYNFGEVPGTITGIVFLDANKNGALDPGEPGIGGVQITLTSGTGTLTVPTAADGSYSFANLPADSYTVTETQPTGFGDPPAGPFAPNARPVVLPPGATAAKENFGDTVGSISGSVYVDLNNNGVRDPGEPGIPNANVTLDGIDAAGRDVPPVIATTAADGAFIFPNLLGGTYTLTEAQPAGFQDGLDQKGTSGGTVGNDVISAITLGAGVDATNYTFAELGAVVGGVSYLDRNQDGSYQPGTDRPLPGVTITLRDAGGNVVGTTATGPDGSYSFVGLPAGTYTLTETQPTGYGNTEAPTNVRTVVVPPNATVADLNFGNTLGSLAGTVYRDFDLNGTLTAGGSNPDTGIPGITVTLRDSGGTVVATTNTDAAGRYRFDDLPTGTYTIAETQPPLPTKQAPGFYDGADNLGSLAGTQPAKNVLVATIGTDPATGASQNGVNYNFGELPPADPFGHVYNDVNRNRVRDPGDPGIANVAITIGGTAFAGTPFARPLAPADIPGGSLTITTDAAGFWQFNPIPPGLYTITEAQPPGYLDGPEVNGDPNPPFTIVVGNDVFSNVDLSPFPARGPLDFTEWLSQAPPAPLPPMGFFPAPPTPDMSKRGFLSSTESPAAATPAGPTGPNFAAFGASPTRTAAILATAEDAGNGWVRVFDYGSGMERFRFQPFGDFSGGVRVATADVTEDGIPDVVAVPGPGGGPLVKVFDGNTGALVLSVLAFEPSFRGGLRVAAADVTGDGAADLIVTPDAGGGPVVRAFDGRTGAVVANFMALDETFRGGLRIATGDVNGDGTPDLLVTAGIGGGPRVAGYDGRFFGTTQAKLFGDFFAFAPELRNGFWVSAGDADGDGTADVVLGAGTGGAPRVVVYSGRALSTGGPRVLSSFVGGDPASRSGAEVRAADLDGDGRAEVVAAGEAGAGPTVYVFDALTGVRRDQFYGFPTDHTGGVSLG